MVPVRGLRSVVYDHGASPIAFGLVGLEAVPPDTLDGNAAAIVDEVFGAALWADGVDDVAVGLDAYGGAIFVRAGEVEGVKFGVDAMHHEYTSESEGPIGGAYRMAVVGVGGCGGDGTQGLVVEGQIEA